MNLPDQVAVLKGRGLIVGDDTFALHKLEFISYYRLANYWRPMEADKTTHQFKPGSRFEDIIRLYDFDMALRSLIFTAIQHVEIAFRSQIIHWFSLSYGAFWFMDPALFKNQSIHNRCLHSLSDEISRTKEEFIVEHFAKYDSPDYPPVWKSLEVASFGTLSKMYSNFADNAEKKKLARSFGLPQHIFLESWMTSIAVLRNCCAHHARTWNRVFSIKPQLPSKLPNDWIAKGAGSPSKLYSHLCCLQYLLNSIGVGDEFRKGLKALLAIYPNVDTDAMGCPKNWMSEPLWSN